MPRHWVKRGELRSQIRTCKHTDAGAMRDIIFDHQGTEFEESEAQSPVGKGGFFDLFFIVGEYDFARD